MNSKYETSDDPKVSLGPVFAINPRFVREVVIYPGWVEVRGVSPSVKLTTELEEQDVCEALAAEFVAANPAISVVRHDEV